MWRKTKIDPRKEKKGEVAREKSQLTLILLQARANLKKEKGEGCAGDIATACCLRLLAILQENSLYDIEVKIKLRIAIARMTVPTIAAPNNPLSTIINVTPLTNMKHNPTMAKTKFFRLRIIIPAVKANPKTMTPSTPSPSKITP